jgi:hypothetical protein
MPDMSKLLVRVLSSAWLACAVACSSEGEDAADAGDAQVRQESSAARAENEGMEQVTQAGRPARAPRADAGMDASTPAAPTKSRTTAKPANEPEPEPDLDDDAGTEPLPDCLPFDLPADCPAVTGLSSPLSLHCAGLYADLPRGIVACGLTEYTPAYELWSDGAVKRRWVSLPPDARVDTTDPDAFVYPVGTQFWKEFQVMSSGELRRAETRLLRKVERGWVFTTYVWSADGNSATATNNGVNNWQRTGHTVPTRDQCVDCHGGRRDLVLGWDPVLLGPGARGIHYEDLLVSDDDAGTPAVPTTPPGDAIEQAALGYLHVNCGVSCHNETIDARARDTALNLRLATARNDGVLQTPAFSAINKLPTGNAPFFELEAPPEGPFYDVLPGSPARSLLLARMLVRDHPAQMPPLASNIADETGAAAVRTWIEQMTPERGYPTPAP